MEIRGEMPGPPPQGSEDIDMDQIQMLFQQLFNFGTILKYVSYLSSSCSMPVIKHVL